MTNYTNVFLKRKLTKIVKAKGIYIYTNNKKVLDVTSGTNHFAILGWAHPKVNSAIIKQLKKFSHIDIKTWHDENLDILSKIVLSKKKHRLSKVFFTGNSGAEACEAAIRMSYQYFLNKGFKKKKFFISREESYHGCSGLSLMLGDRPNFKKFSPLNPNINFKIKEHNLFKYMKKNENENEYAKRSAAELEKTILKIGPNNVCGFVGETIMGGLQGDIPPAKNYWKYIRKVCDKYNIHLILDEVYCGMGVSGKIYCIDYDNISPDFIFTGKQLAAGYAPISMLLTSEKIINELKKDGRIGHSTTHQGYSLGIAASIAVQKIVHKKENLKKVYDNGNYMRKILHTELNDTPTFRNVRGRGYRFSLEHETKNNIEFTKELSSKMYDQDNILINSKWHRTCITPAIIITKDQIDFFLERFIHTFKKISKKNKYAK